ncbi:MAG: GH92 family glycosyl hydrolase, partial [Candidatus Hydrogenedentes bacterium]|nr:GH92 family glycosyl hydrolase [Candidatus Hydrogenedentota bacterium]
MKKLLKAIVYALCIALLVCGAALLAIVAQARRVVREIPGGLEVPVEPGERGRWVNPFVGTGGIPYVCGHNFPGAARPFGMVRVSPDTASILINRRALNTSGYYYGDNKILGFSHTRLVGTGATDGGHFLVVPTVEPVFQGIRRRGQFAPFSHRDEVAFPGYYAVQLREPPVRCELTATERAGLHRYTFAADTTPHILIDVTSALGRGRSKEGHVQVLPETQEIEGSARTFGSFSSRYGGLKAYFVARFDRPFAEFGVWDGGVFYPGRDEAAGNEAGVDVGFAQRDGQQAVELRLGLSYVSIANARANLEVETGGRSFDAILADAQAAWEHRLSAIRVRGGTDKQRTIFYTALYRALQMPTVFNDVNGDYLGFDGHVHKAGGFRYFTDLSLWDTFRTVHPLFTLIAPADQRDMMVSLVRMAEQGGWLPRWPSGHGYTNSMLGTPADIAIAEAYLKGIRGFDVETAYRAMRQTALGTTPPDGPFSGREGVEHYLEFGYCPADLMKEAVARTLEFAYADHAIALLAHELGYDEDAALLAEHAGFYRNLWNPQTGYFQPRTAQGAFVEPFRPRLLTYLDRTGEYTNDYVEGSALQWRWAVPFDAEGLIGLFDSPERFARELNDFFAQADPARGAWNPGPYYWHGNEPDLYAAYLFNDAGRPDLTQRWVRWILDNKYGTRHDGLDGNDDAGTLSAWYVFSALGIYPVAGSDKYQIGSPVFERADIALGEARLSIVADNYAPGHIYVHRVLLNGEPLDRWWFRHSEIAGGAELRFEMA